MPVQSGFFNHQVMTLSVKNTSPCHDQHNDIDDNAREYMESMKTGDRKKEIGKIG